MIRRTSSILHRGTPAQLWARNTTHGKSTTKHTHLSPAIDNTAGKIWRCLTLHDVSQQNFGSRRVLPSRHPEHIAEGQLSSFATYAFLQQGRLLCYVRSSGWHGARRGGTNQPECESCALRSIREATIRINQLHRGRYFCFI